MSTLSWVALEGLVEAGLVRPLPGSLLHHLKAPYRSEPADRAQALAALRGDQTSMAAAGILAHADAVLEVAEVQRGSAPVVLRAYVAGARACAAAVADDGVRIEAPVATKQLVEQLTRKLLCTSAAPGTQARGLLPSEVALVTQLWPAHGQGISTSQARRDALAALTTAGVGPKEADAALQALVQSGLLVADAAAVRVDASFFQPLEALFSGQLIELRTGALDGSTSATALFVGPESNRFELERLPAELWQRAINAGARASDEDLLVFHRHTRAQLKQRLASMLPTG